MERCKSKMILTRKELKLIDLIRKTESDEVRISIQDKQPVKVEEVKRAVRL